MIERIRKSKAKEARREQGRASGQANTQPISLSRGRVTMKRRLADAKERCGKEPQFLSGNLAMAPHHSKGGLLHG